MKIYVKIFPIDYQAVKKLLIEDRFILLPYGSVLSVIVLL